ncbi:hypothetical protein BDP81DRAFT_61750 [Colletotrichum phormii]|uniref:Secreted protein n=1 Tax=Colletotrichum phormii TaxID=359342 RepID=A0AAJ0EEB9_9PEZI|nr:uncharacterized protein BDP81DRAFT_61750 [Colletotrichum phormii]KAK1633835.1 hypothetical protein BDP81DRAFT_61750 [Colletotrichum phormii]
MCLLLFLTVANNGQGCVSRQLSPCMQVPDAELPCLYCSPIAKRGSILFPGCWQRSPSAKVPTSEL